MILSKQIEETKQKLSDATNRILVESGLPAYLTERIILGILADIRERKAIELTQDLASANNKLEKQNDEMQKINAELRKQLKKAKEGEADGKH